MATDLTPKKSDEVSGLLGRTVDSVVQGLTGLAASEKKDVALSVGHIIQRMRAGKFVQTVKDEWDNLVAKGKIQEEFVESEQNLDCLQDLLDFIDKDVPDAQRFAAMKNLYLHVAVDADSPRPDYLPQQLMKVCRSLSSGEIIVLLTTYKVTLSQRSFQENHVSASGWLKTIADESGLYGELVQIYEETLITKGFLPRRIHSDGSGVVVGKHFRLTELAVALCQRIAASPV